MRFLLFTLEYLPFKGGVANYYTNLVYYWPNISNIFVLSNDNNKLLRRKGPFKWLKGFLAFYKYVKKNKINHVLVGQILPLGTIVFLLSDLLKIKYTIIFHGLDFSMATKNKIKKFITKIILKKADKIICANSTVFEMLNIFMGKNNKSFVVNPGVKDFDFDLSENKKILINKYNLENKKIIFSLGRLVKRKGFDNVIKALQDFDYSDLVYIISGEGPDRQYLENLAKSQSTSTNNKKILFTGEISELDKWTFFSLSDFFIMPARNISGDYEGFGIVYLEANLAQKAVIGGNSGGVGDAIINNYNGLLVNPDDPKEILSAIKKLLNDQDLRNKLGQQGRVRALKDFAWKDKVNEIYNFVNT